MNDFLDRYFSEQIDYPSLHEAKELLPLNTIYFYVASSFLNGFINIAKHGKLLRAYLSGRYRPEDEALDKVPAYRLDNGDWFIPTDTMTKKQAFEMYTQPNRLSNTELGMFQDDVVMLFKGTFAGGQEYYWFFWFDCDAADCCIGRFTTTDSEEVVLTTFDRYIDNSKLVNGYHEAWELPKHFFTGWLSF